jgi:DNA-nicking Smr family endonuclease
MAAKKRRRRVGGSRSGREASGPFEALRTLKDELRATEGAPKAPAEAPPTQPASDPEDDALLFHRLYAGVTPLGRSPGRLPKDPVDRSASAARAAGREPGAQEAEADSIRDRLRELVEGQARFEVTDDGERVEGRRVDLPLDALRRLRRGLLPVDARIDLHGMGVKEARGQLELFLRTMRGRGERCALVIHGKGEHSPQGVGVLRGEIAAWLSQGTSSHHVAAFATAREHDGGEGAVYVLLRR